ncbi:calcium-binding protein [Paludibacterium purpuratum]|uniref:Hemolysin type calcium-binding protein n=1 Tax=Paludibacterium purpuratum TaxID=1144873 RepID=A0A4R7AVC3_9NEIS|nr:calcium-binding protein [Paludibacterium purpuratum]TDR71071.1 hypothetical protein DFP86_12026 [Paludibacterium purpuratum]
METHIPASSADATQSSSGLRTKRATFAKADNTSGADAGDGVVVVIDGQRWTLSGANEADVRRKLLSMASTDGDDTINGFSSPDILKGGLGNDVLAGGSGNDKYYYYRGDGHDTIIENRDGGFDYLELKGIHPDEVTVARNGNDYIVHIRESSPGANDGGSVTLKDMFRGEDYTGFNRGVEVIVFHDATTSWNLDTMLAKLSEPAGDDNIGGGTWVQDVLDFLGQTPLPVEAHFAPAPPIVHLSEWMSPSPTEELQRFLSQPASTGMP